MNAHSTIDRNPLMEVAVWMDAFKVQLNTELQETLVFEETMEALDALEAIANEPDAPVEAFAHVLKELADVTFVMIGAVLMSEEDGKTFQWKERTAYLSAGLAHAIDFMTTTTPGINALMDEAFYRVVESNMSKLGEDGQPILREDGKVLKGPNYKEPYLTDLGEQLKALWVTA